MVRLLLASVLMLVLGAAACWAGDPALEAREVLRAHGYDGVWSMHCDVPPTNAVPRIDWRVPAQGPVQQWVDIGGGYRLEGVVAAASVTPDGRFTLEVRSLGGVSWVRTTVPAGDDAIRIWEMRTMWRGRVQVDMRGGHDLRTDQETPPIEKCVAPGALVS